VLEQTVSSSLLGVMNIPLSYVIYRVWGGGLAPNSVCTLCNAFYVGPLVSFMFYSNGRIF